MAKFLKSAEFNYALAGAGALTGVYLSPFVNNATAQFGNVGQGLANLAIGAASFAAGMYVQNDEASAFLVGFGITYAVEGLLRLFMPNVQPFNSVALASTSLVGSSSKKVAAPMTATYY